MLVHLSLLLLSFSFFLVYSYVREDGKQLVASGDMSVELGMGEELVITSRSDRGVSTKILGSREYLRYYRQAPHPSPMNGAAIIAALASRFEFDPIVSALSV